MGGRRGGLHAGRGDAGRVRVSVPGAVQRLRVARFCDASNRVAKVWHSACKCAAQVCRFFTMLIRLGLGCRFRPFIPVKGDFRHREETAKCVDSKGQNSLAPAVQLVFRKRNFAACIHTSRKAVCIEYSYVNSLMLP